MGVILAYNFSNGERGAATTSVAIRQRRWRCAQHAETVLRFIPFSAAREESAVSFPRRKSNCGAQFTRITAAAGGTGCAGVNTRNSQATGTAAATI